MNIKREFLSTDEAKFIPLQLTTSSYGVAETNPTSDFITGDTEVHITEVVFPAESSNLVYLLDYGTRDVVQVYASPPGTITVNLEIPNNGITYSVYVVSKEYIDGFISGGHKISTDFLGDQLKLNYNDNPPQSIDLTLDGAMVESLGRDDQDPTQWYNYTGSYNFNTLIWSSPV
ncbi:MAG: hypothetical protein KUG81_08895, partial [Gammaproteobacteria bacterium]|nr:hypothetical protein [Gammaproteobacteria bacterium]